MSKSIVLWGVWDVFLGGLAWGLSGMAVLGVTILAAMATGQLVNAARYRVVGQE